MADLVAEVLQRPHEVGLRGAGAVVVDGDARLLGVWDVARAGPDARDEGLQRLGQQLAARPGPGADRGGGTYTVVRTRNPTQSKGSPPKKSDVASFCAVTRETFEDDMGAD